MSRGASLAQVLPGMVTLPQHSAKKHPTENTNGLKINTSALGQESRKFRDVGGCSNTNGGGNTREEIRFGLCIPAGGMGTCELSPTGSRQPYRVPGTCTAPCPACFPAGARGSGAGSPARAGRAPRGSAGSPRSSSCCRCCRQPGRRWPSTGSARSSRGHPGVGGVAEPQSSRGPAMVQLLITPPMPYLVSSVHHLQEHRLLVHQLLRGVGVLCKKGGYEDELAHPVFFKPKQSPGCLGYHGKISALMRSILHQCLPPYSFLRQHYFGGLVVMLLGKPGLEQLFLPVLQA